MCTGVIEVYIAYRRISRVQGYRSGTGIQEYRRTRVIQV
jgi:hypothetical protein